ncbi:hypothetical protein LEP1GSC020_3176 [Leptospira interrogans serovar Grippotyphosa str. 2006006986]|nr:hypothetical protein LEP1GSC009_4139 [Leptospira interrogans serovar Grippotyphosa str. Andaman]EKP83530.1 hypothetical protein LEP1GSC020_3176 [Leptospira interrogans serovar Grippotyphosa str. 2006006986]EMN54840.1 hypothetical protein LEP1GSC089_2801 [Leptospira interrogans serovar Autumnalis str. LP101]EMN79785.1 hypothetical protein LEP1GSC106_3456 [Leptospira interrogans serovar Grippotyphosa str. UI 12764]
MDGEQMNEDLSKKEQAVKEVGFLLKNLLVEIRVGELSSKVLIHNYTHELVKVMGTFFPNRS